MRDIRDYSVDEWVEMVEFITYRPVEVLQALNAKNSAPRADT